MSCESAGPWLEAAGLRGVPSGYCALCPVVLWPLTTHHWTVTLRSSVFEALRRHRRFSQWLAAVLLLAWLSPLVVPHAADDDLLVRACWRLAGRSRPLDDRHRGRSTASPLRHLPLDPLIPHRVRGLRTRGRSASRPNTVSMRSPTRLIVLLRSIGCPRAHLPPEQTLSRLVSVEPSRARCRPVGCDRTFSTHLFSVFSSDSGRDYVFS